VRGGRRRAERVEAWRDGGRVNCVEGRGARGKNCGEETEGYYCLFPCTFLTDLLEKLTAMAWKGWKIINDGIEGMR